VKADDDDDEDSDMAMAFDDDMKDICDAVVLVAMTAAAAAADWHL